MDIWVVTYEHKHGVDVSVYSTEDHAWDAVAAIKAADPEDFDEEDPQSFCDVTMCQIDS